MSDKAQPNALGLDFSQPVQAQEEESPASAVQSPTLETPKKKELPYVNPDRVRTGGTQKGKLSEQELAERMARIREQNEKIKQRRLHVQEDEEAFRKHAEEDQARKEEYRKKQDEINATRATNAKLKMDLVGTREWDAVKAAEEDGWTEENAGGRGGKRRRDRRPRGDYDVGAGGGESITNDWAKAPIEENVNNWGEAPIGGDISQWLPNTATTQKNADSTDWAALEVTQDRNPASTGTPKYKGKDRDSKDNAAWSTDNKKKKNDSFKPVPPESDPTPANVNDWGGEPVPERDWGQALTRADGEDDKTEEANEIPADWAADPVSTIAATEGATDWAGNPLPSAADWGPTPASQELSHWLETSANAGIPAGSQDGYGRGRGRGRGEGRGRGRGASDRGGRGRVDGERGGRGRGEGGGRGRGEGRGRGRGRGDGEYRGGRGGRGRGDERF